MQAGMIGVFDSGYGGLTVLSKIREVLPEYSYYYLGDNARAPYGSRSLETVYQYTRECVKKLFDLGCPLVILACNTASAKALRKIQQENLSLYDPSRRVLGVIRPTVEMVPHFTKTHHVGLLATQGTVESKTYNIELQHLSPHIILHTQACPLWVPLIENHEYENPGAEYFIQLYTHKLLAQHQDIDTIILGCTHYPLIQTQIQNIVGEHIRIVAQGEIVANSLKEYLRRHPEMESRLAKTGDCQYYTTESVSHFSVTASFFLQQKIQAQQIKI